VFTKRLSQRWQASARRCEGDDHRHYYRSSDSHNLLATFGRSL
jgi:hypothetical protein